MTNAAAAFGSRVVPVMAMVAVMTVVRVFVAAGQRDHERDRHALMAELEQETRARRRGHVADRHERPQQEACSNERQ